MTTSVKQNYFDIVAKNNVWPSREELNAAIEAATQLVAKPDDAALLMQLNDILDGRMLRDYSGQLSEKVLLVPGDGAEEPGEVSYYVVQGHEDPSWPLNPLMCDLAHFDMEHFPFANMLKLLVSAESNFDKQNMQSLRTDTGLEVTAAPKKLAYEPYDAKKARAVKKIQKAVLAKFKEEVVEMLVSVKGVKLSMTLTDNREQVLKEPVTDALFYAWSYGDRHPEVVSGCLYDFMCNGDAICLKATEIKVFSESVGPV